MMMPEHPWPSLETNENRDVELFLHKRNLIDELKYYIKKGIYEFRNIRTKAGNLF